MQEQSRHPRDPALLLKSTPPKVGPGFLERDRLRLDQLLRAGTQVIPVFAPTGFGKTSQLASWRREALAAGAVAVWYTADGRDDPLRFVRGLALAAQAACGRKSLSEPFMAWIAECTEPQEAVTGLLGMVAELAKDVWLFLDDIDLLPTPARNQALEYLLGNLPANVHVALAARPTAALKASGTLNSAPSTRTLASDLRFTVPETLAVLSAAMGRPCPPDTAVRLHEMAEGWPLGIRLAAAALHRGRELPSLLSAASADIRRYFVNAVIERQPVATVEMLVRLSPFETIHPQLAAATLGPAAPVDELARLCDETPLVTLAEEGEWIRMHPAAREALRERFAELPADERSQIARRASQCFAQFGLYESAAEQSLLAGDASAALALVEKHSHEMTVLGRGAAVFTWYQRLSQQEIRRHPGLWSSAAWSLAMSDRHAEARELIDLILAQPGVSEAVRFETSLIAGTVAGFADRLDRLSAQVDGWHEPPPDATPMDIGPYYVGRGLHALYDGQTEQARRCWSMVPSLSSDAAYSPVSAGYAAYGTGLSYCWEGRYALALEVLEPALRLCEEGLGRNHQVSCMVAAVAAHAAWECDRGDDVRPLLAGRMKVLEHFALPEALMLAYRALAQQAEHDGRQDQALSLLDALQAIGEARGVVRLQVAAQYELVQLHSRRRRPDAAHRHLQRLMAVMQAHQASLPEPNRRWVILHADLARAMAALAHPGNSHLAEALAALDSAAESAQALSRGAKNVQILLLRSEILRRRGNQSEANALHAEAQSLANANGMTRILREVGTAGGTAGEPADAPAASRTRPDRAAESTANRNASARTAGLLTQKESEVLALLSRNLSNKEIAMAMAIGEQTVKWHLKNLFNKLSAGTRKHLVARARLIGLVDG